MLPGGTIILTLSISVMWWVKTGFWLLTQSFGVALSRPTRKIKMGAKIIKPIIITFLFGDIVAY